MTYTYNVSDNIGKVRLLVPDRVNTAAEPAIFEDEEIAVFLDLEGGVYRAAAQALETIASDQALVLKVMRVQNVQTDGAKLAAELRARAAGLRRQAEEQEAAEGELFDVAEWVNDPFSRRDKLYKEALRRGL